MSYILDALRRADAERERGAVPDLHAQPLQSATAESEASRSSPPWIWMALGVLLVLVIALAWKLLAGAPPAEGPRVAANAPMAPPAQATQSATPTPAPAQAANPTPAPASASSALPTQFPSQALSEITPTPREPRAPAAQAASAAAAKPSAAQAPAAAAPAPTAAASAEERIYALNELPDEIRRSLPALPIGGSTYSQNAASRMLIVNGQVFREGDAITPELKLEQIRLKGAVLRFRGYRYAITF